MVRACSKGQGVDRHLYGLKCQSIRHFKHCDQSIFNSPAYQKLTNTILSTSNCGNPSLRLFGFGPTSPEGYGIGYIIKDDSMQFCVSSKHRQTARYIMTLQKFMNAMKDLLKEEEAQTVRSMAEEEDGKKTTSDDEEGMASYDFYGISETQLKQYQLRQSSLRSVGEALPTTSDVSFPASAAAVAAVAAAENVKAPTWSAGGVQVPPTGTRRSSGIGSDLQSEMFGY